MPAWKQTGSQFIQVAKGAFGLTVAAIPGPHHAREPVVAERAAICDSCAEKFYDSKGREKCKVCGCFLIEKRSIRWEVCPRKLW